MEKLRKLAEVLWYNKERMVLAFMVLVLCWNVYRVFNPPPPEAEKTFAIPGSEPPAAEGTNVPDMPPRQSKSWETVYIPNPFWTLSSQAAESGNRDGDPGITLLKIRTVGGTNRAQLKTASTKWYTEGESFESFKLLKIDPEQQTCLVYSERLARNVTLRVTGR